MYYMREGALPADVTATAKLVRMRSMKADVESVLVEFFVLTPAGWVHARCESEIEAMQERQNMAKAKANKRWDMHRSEHSNAASGTQHMPGSEHSNAEPMPRHKKKNATAYAAASNSDAEAMLPTPTPIPINNTSASEPPDGVSISVWQDFQKLRKVKKAPLTNTSIDGIRREAEKAGWRLDDALQECCARGWTGFKADWVSAKQVNSTATGFV